MQGKLSAILDFGLWVLKYWLEVFGYVFIRFLVPENHIMDTKILILGAIRKKLSKPPTAMAAILDLGQYFEIGTEIARVSPLISF